MKTTLDFKDRVYQIVVAGGFLNHISEIYTDTSVGEPGSEFLLITSPGVGHDDDIVDKCDITCNLLLADTKGVSDNLRFRYLTPILQSILENYKPLESDFVQYGRGDDGGTIESEVETEHEYFHINPVWSDGVHHDPERDGYSYYSIRSECWIEK